MESEIFNNVMSVAYALGMPAIIGGAMWVGFKSVLTQLGAIKKGTQASLRNAMIQMWEKYSDLGYAPIWVKDDFENVYQQYHALGVNGVMDDIHNKFLALPTEAPKNSLRKLKKE